MEYQPEQNLSQFVGFDDVTDSSRNLALPPEEAEQSKRVDRIYDPTLEHVNIVFIGHVDHGKSTLCGRIVYECGGLDERTIEKYKRLAKENKRESWWIAYMMDEDESERRRGKTIDFARATVKTDVKRYDILDAPGHKNYVPMMMDGAAQADVGIVVVSARVNEFEAGFNKNGQTREHILLAKTLGVSRLVVAVTKMDDDTVKWSSARFESIQSSLTTFLNAVGFSGTPFVPVSGYTGINVLTLNGAPSWYRGSPLVSTLDNLPPIPRQLLPPVIMPITLVESEAGKTLIFGKVESGTISLNQTLTILPGSIPLVVESLFPTYASLESAYEIPAGENIRIDIGKTGTEGFIRRGCVITDLPTTLTVSSLFSAEIKILKLPPPGIFSKGYRAVIHIHTETLSCEVKHIIAELDKASKRLNQTPPYIKVGAKAEVVLGVERPIVLMPFAHVSMLGRFTLRVGAETVGFGKVLKCK